MIASHLNDKQEENLKTILRKYREAIGWDYNRHKGIESSYSTKITPRGGVNRCIANQLKTSM